MGSSLTRIKPKVIFVLGPPGAGKGTMCERIVEEFGYQHLSAGELLRSEQSNSNSKYGKIIQNHMIEGTIVPVSITCSLLENAMNQSKKNKFLIDGFPRNQDNVDGWNESLKDKTELQTVLFFDCSLEICLQRCLKRGIGRSDDNEETLKKRVQTYLTETSPIISYYEKMGLVNVINSTDSPDSVYLNVKSILNKLKS